MAGNDQKPSGNVDSAVRERLLRAAVDSFAAFGFEGSSLRTIAQQAGVAFQLITYYFGSKEDLWIAAVDYLFASRLKSSQVVVDHDMEFPQQLRTWVHTAISLSIREPQLRQIMCQEFLAHSERYDKHIRVQARDHDHHPRPQLHIRHDRQQSSQGGWRADVAHGSDGNVFAGDRKVLGWRVRCMLTAQPRSRKASGSVAATH